MTDGLRRRIRQTLPFAGIAALGILLVPFPGQRLEWVDWLLGGLLTIAVWVAILFVPWRRVRPVWGYLPLAGSLIAVALVRDATGGATGGLGALVLLPVVWVALYGDRAQLAVASAGTAIVWAYPLIAVGDPKYPAWGWRTAAVFVALALVIGSSVQRLVLRRRADAAEREQLLARLAALAATDELTGLANRRTWDRALLGLDPERDAPLALAVLDLDGFKALNDACGHLVGDQALKACTAAWQELLEPEDLLARLGGDEFGLLLRRRGADHAAALVEALCAVSEEIVGCSAGVALWRGETPAVLQARADAHLYAAKRAGGGRCRIDAEPAPRR